MSTASIPCGEPYPYPTPVVHFNASANWWDTTTVPLPWVKPYIAPTQVPFVTITSGGAPIFTYPTQEQKAELVLAVLLNVLMGKDSVTLSGRTLYEERDTIEFVYNEDNLTIRVPKKMRYSEIVNALYEEFGNLRGKEIR